MNDGGEGCRKRRSLVVVHHHNADAFDVLCDRRMAVTSLYLLKGAL